MVTSATSSTTTTTPATSNQSTNKTLSSTGSTIVSQLTSGSGIDTSALVGQLTELTHSVQSTKLDTRKQSLETQISDLGRMRSALSTLQSSVALLGNRDTFNAKSLAIPNTSLLAITSLQSSAAAGNYSLKVDQIAQSQSLSSGSFSSATQVIGKGTMTIRLGDWSADGSSFSVNNDKPGVTLTIDESNNTLAGLRDALNKSGIGIQASIVSDGGSSRLLITAPTGETSELEISVQEDPASPGLSAFNFNENDKQVTQQQEGKSAQIRLNGMLLTRDSNRLTDVIPGLEFDIFNSSTTEVVNIGISADKTIAEQAIRDFVESYNLFMKEMKTLTGYNAETEEYGSLSRDPLAKNLVQSVRNTMSASVPGIDGLFTALSSLAIRTEKDGSLKIVEDGSSTDFNAALANHYDKIVDLFTPKASSATAGIDVTAYGARTAAGSYEVVITQQSEKGRLDADALTSLDTTGKDYSFTFSIDGNETSLIQLPANKVYASGNELASDLQSLINADSTVRAGGAAVEVRFNTTTSQLEFVSNTYGSSSQVSILSASADAAELGLSEKAGTAGKDVAGTVDGVAGFGYGNVLLPAIGSKAEGLSMIISPGSTGGTISFSRGFAGQLSSIAENFVNASGLINDRETTLKKDLSGIGDEKTALERRTEAYRVRLTSQFLAMESIVRSLKSTGSFLDGIVDRLPFTSKN